ncbi:hypothetical protein V8B97DRAFT_609936 [Scleroderma yunnanense]
MRLVHVLLSFVPLSWSILVVEAFSVTVGTATQCSPLAISWSGGQGPFEVMVFPVFSVPIFYSVPSTAYSGNKGSYTISQLPLPQGTQFVLTMSDSTGFATGGTSDLITVGGPSSSNCNTTSPSLPYFFSVSPSSPQQCASSTFFGYQGAVLPVTVWGIIPGGQSFVVQAGVSTANCSWTTDVPAGTSIIFSVIDADNRTGGTSGLEVVQPGDSSCLNSNSPSSTPSVPQSSTPTAFTTTSASPSQTSSNTPSKISTATIIGVAAGGVVALAALAFLGLFLARKGRARSPMYSLATQRDMPLLHSDDDPNTPRHPRGLPYQDHVQAFPPPDSATSPPTSRFPQGTHSSLPTSSPSPPSTSVMASSGRGKGMTVLTPARYIVHTDAEDAGAEVIELPPQYSERQVPGPQSSQLRPMSSVSAYGPTDLAYASDAFMD